MNMTSNFITKSKKELSIFTLSDHEGECNDIFDLDECFSIGWDNSSTQSNESIEVSQDSFLFHIQNFKEQSQSPNETMDSLRSKQIKKTKGTKAAPILRKVHRLNSMDLTLKSKLKVSNKQKSSLKKQVFSTKYRKGFRNVKPLKVKQSWRKFKFCEG